MTKTHDVDTSLIQISDLYDNAERYIALMNMELLLDMPKFPIIKLSVVLVWTVIGGSTDIDGGEASNVFQIVTWKGKLHENEIACLKL